MNPIPLNDRGQFRYTDLVSYIPQFLQEEPDVVEFLQVMSDYINDAYRNIEDVEEFEFKLCTAEAGVSRATALLSRLRTMLDLASTRGERVCYLSVPRANAKSNEIFGKANGHTPYYVDVGFTEISDEIRDIASIDRRVGDMDDGDVVFVRYVALNPVVTKQYYYSRESNSLIVDPEGTSQDPFTNTDNAGNRMISFEVHDISSVGRRYGGENGGNSYYEVFFTARISGVKSEPATAKMYFDVDHVDEAADEVYVDYYDMEYVPKGKYHASVEFFNADGWQWKDGYPTGIFYLKTTSGAKLDTVGLNDSAKYANTVDPTVLMDTDRYTLSAPVRVDAATGTCRFYTTTCFPQSDGGRFYLMNKNTGSCVGEFIAEPREYVDGRYCTEARPVWLDDIGGMNDPDTLFIMAIPLFFNRGLPDQGSSSVRLNWKFVGGEYVPMDWSKAKFERIEQVPGEKVRPLGKPFQMTADRRRDNGSIYVPYDVYDAISEAGGEGTELSCGMTAWTGSPAIVDKIDAPWYYGTEGVPGGLLTVAGNTQFLPVASQYSLQLYTGYNGSITVTEDGDIKVYRSGNLDISGIVPGESVAIYSANGVTCASTITGVNDGTVPTFTMEPVPEPGCYDLVVGRPDRENGYAAGMAGVYRTSDGWVVGDCGKCSGDVFTDGMFRVTDGKVTAFVTIGTGVDGVEVERYETGRTYRKGDTVYSPVDDRLYTCVSDYTPEAFENNPASLPYFRVENTIRHRIDYGSVRNRFMPFYGQVRSMEYGERVDYNGDIATVTRPLYITKVVENRLKYGWEHREFLNYGTNIDMSDRPRNGSVEIYSSARSDSTNGFESEYDIVTATLERMAMWSIGYPVVTRGATPRVSIDIDNPVYLVAERKDAGWSLVIQSAGHGMVDGVVLRVAGFETVNGLSINGYWPAHVIDGDTIGIDIPLRPGETTAMSVLIPLSGGVVEYIGDYWLDAMSVSAVESGRPGIYTYELVFAEPVVGVRAGDRLTLVDKTVDVQTYDGHSVEVTVMPDGSAVDRAMRVECTEEIAVSHQVQIRRTVRAGDYVKVGDSVYRVASGMWPEVDPHDVATPATLYARQNIATVSETNPEYALGDDIRVERIIPEGNDTCVVRLKDPLVHFVPENAGVIEGHTMVRLSHVTPGEYNGWHTVTEVISPKSFRMTVRLSEGSVVEGTGVNLSEMILNEGRWYSYTMNAVEWDKISNRVTYSLDNEVYNLESDGETVVTTREHGLSVGDYVIIGDRADIVSLDYGNAEVIAGKIACCRVKAVLGKCTVRVDTVSGAGFSEGNAIARGVLLTDRMDDLGTFQGEYTHELASLGKVHYRFRHGDIVVAAAQQNPAELRAWRVSADGAWQPVRAKRSLKISELDISRYYNSEFDDAEAGVGVDYDKYETYSDVDVAADAGLKYVAGFRDVARARFIVPSLPDMDTTRRASAEYSSGEDFSNVAPRHNMKPGFRGVPSMKYPLAEKIERLCYLRDANVIDFDLIEYLARYLGYDITALGDDVSESGIYRTKAEREKAIRETIADLPQYYTLGGTKPGLHMLMAAFGVIGEALTLWTDAEHPYQSMIYRDEVVEKVEGGEGGKWVPTPYIDLSITNNAKYPQFSARQSDIERIREQIRVYKPINVVFRDIMVRLVDTEYLAVSATLAGSGVAGNGGAIDIEGEELVVDYGNPSLNNCAF